MSATNDDFYGFLEASASDLTRGGRVALLAIRAWVEARAVGACPVRAVAELPILTGYAFPVASFHAFLCAWDRAPRGPGRVSRREAARVTEDEALMLSGLAAIQIGNRRAARAALGALVPEAMLPTLEQSAAFFAFAFAEAGARVGGRLRAAA